VLHLRIISPPDRTARVERVLTDNVAATHVVVLPGVARDPAGDLITVDVAREGTSDVLELLRELGLDRDGSIVMERAAADQHRRDRRRRGAHPAGPADRLAPHMSHRVPASRGCQ
jgi:hypothetical protein